MKKALVTIAVVVLSLWTMVAALGYFMDGNTRSAKMVARSFEDLTISHERSMDMIVLQHWDEVAPSVDALIESDAGRGSVEVSNRIVELLSVKSDEICSRSRTPIVGSNKEVVGIDPGRCRRVLISRAAEIAEEKFSDHRLRDLLSGDLDARRSQPALPAAP